MKHLVYILLMVLGTCGMTAQELNIKVKVTTPKLKLADPAVFKAMETAISEFYNNTKWTEDDFDDNEKIEGDLLIAITEEISTNSFLADFRLQTIRPVYHSSYSTQILNHVDKEISITFTEYQPIENNKNAYTDNFSSILTFYAYVILGFDYDTFAPLGGESNFQIAQNIINNIPPSVSDADQSWSALGPKRSRYKLMENILNPRCKDYRQAYYDYHRHSMDRMASDVDNSVNVMLEGLKSIDIVNRNVPNSMILGMFADSKRDEIIEIFKPADKNARTSVYRIMTAIDPAQADRYNPLKK